MRGGAPISKVSTNKPLWWISTISIYGALLSLFVIDSDRFFYGADFVAWRDDWRVFQDCVGTWACGNISKFPIAYLVNSWIAARQGGLSSGENALHVTNVCFIILPLVVVWILRPRQEAAFLGIAYLAAIAFSPLPSFYLPSGALEIQAGVVIGVFIGSLILWLDGRDSQSRIALIVAVVSGALMIFYKDVILFQVIIAVFLSIAVRIYQISSVDRRRLISDIMKFGIIAAPAFLFSGIGVLLYNYLRYQTILPSAYLSEAAATAPPAWVAIRFLLWSIVSPNGGIAAFWFFPYAVFAGGLHLLGFRPVKTALWATGSLIALSLISFAFWWAPFGWDSWGDRLIMPASLAAIVAIMLSARRADAPIAAIPWPRLIFCSPLILYSAYYWVVPLVSDNRPVFVASLNTGPGCETMQQMIANESGPRGLAIWKDKRYYACAWERFRHVPMPLSR